MNTIIYQSDDLTIWDTGTVEFECEYCEDGEYVVQELNSSSRGGSSPCHDVVKQCSVCDGAGVRKIEVEELLELALEGGLL